MKHHDALFLRCARELLSQTQLQQESNYIQHGSTNTLLHSLAVAYYGYLMCRALRIAVSERSLLRGALLHDYYLYDWHASEGHPKLHGFYHPGIALKNAERDLTEPLNHVERDIIRKHMFPLTLKPPVCRESLIICLTDKGCALYETFVRKHPYPRIRRLVEALELDIESGEA